MTMRIIARYLWKEFFKLLLLCQVFFVFLYLVIDFIQKIDNFMEAEADGYAVLQFLMYKTPLIAVQMAPVAALISVIVMFSIMKKNHEITALKASGISIFRLCLPVLVAAMALSIAVFIFSELVVPYASTKSNDIWYREVKKQDQRRFYNRSNIWYKGTKAIYWIRHFDGENMVMEEPSFYLFDDSFHLIKRIDARRAVWAEGRWTAEEGILQEKKSGDLYELEHFNEMGLTVAEDPESFLKTVRRPEEMSYWELKHFAEKTALEGYEDTHYKVDLNGKLAFPLLSFVIVLIGIPTAIGLKKGGPPLAVSLGIVTCFIYVMIHGLSRSLGLAGVLPPILSAWMANLTFLFIGIYVMMRMET